MFAEQPLAKQGGLQNTVIVFELLLFGLCLHIDTAAAAPALVEG